MQIHTDGFVSGWESSFQSPESHCSLFWTGSTLRPGEWLGFWDQAESQNEGAGHGSFVVDTFQGVLVKN